MCTSKKPNGSRQYPGCSEPFVTRTSSSDEMYTGEKNKWEVPKNCWYHILWNVSIASCKKFKETTWSWVWERKIDSNLLQVLDHDVMLNLPTVSSDVSWSRCKRVSCNPAYCVTRYTVSVSCNPAASFVTGVRKTAWTFAVNLFLWGSAFLEL